MGAGVRLLLSALFAPVLAYLAAMVVLGLLPANAGWVEAEEGVVVFVNTNGVHTGIGMPVANEVMDWRPFMPAAHLKTPIAADYVFVGYGHRAFYLETESWADLSPELALDAAFGGGATLVHVDHVLGPGEGPEQREVTLSREEYRRLALSCARASRWTERGARCRCPGAAMASMMRSTRRRAGTVCG
jgi:uncharacterized protein (TIGR02117 family)